MSYPCQVCGAPDSSCGHTPLVFPPISFEKGANVASTTGKIILPQQSTKRGKAGYKGANIDVVNADGKVVGHGKVDKK
jgi:hypothetical protein